MKICSVEGCERVSKSRGWCGMHYARWYHHGDTSVVMPRNTYPPWEHGTHNGYSNHHCRCALCREAHRVYYREVVKGPCPGGCGGTVSNRYVTKLCMECRHKLLAAQHGSEARYKAGCRCRLCLDASSAARRERRKVAKIKVELKEMGIYQ